MRPHGRAAPGLVRGDRAPGRGDGPGLARRVRAASLPNPIRPSEVGLRNTFTERGSAHRGREDRTLNDPIERLRATIDPDERVCFRDWHPVKAAR